MHIKKKGFVLITTILYSLLIFLIIESIFLIISNNREDTEIKRKVTDNINYFQDIDEIITNLNIKQDEIRYVVNEKKEKSITSSLKLSFNETENCFYIIPWDKEDCKMKLIYIKEAEKYILYPYFEK